MKPTVRLGRVAGIPLAAHWSALVIPVLVADLLGSTILPETVKHASRTEYWATAALVAFLFLLSLVAHEVAHALTARRQGLQVNGITLWMLGGVTSIDGDPKTPRADLEIAVVGPATSLACGAVAAGVALVLHLLDLSPVVVAGATWLAITNGLLAVFNMLPGAPLDGGRVLRAVLWRRSGDRLRAEEAAARTGRGTGIALVAVGLIDLATTGDLIGGLWLALIGWFLMTAAAAEAGAAEAQEAFGDVTVGEVMDGDVTVVPSYQSSSVAARHAVAADADYCTVVDFDGNTVGVVEVNALVHAARLPDPPTVAAVTRPVPPTANARADEVLLDVLRRSGGFLPLVVVDEGAAVGLVTPTALSHALRRGLVTRELVR